jgi:hypothetical protein
MAVKFSANRYTVSEGPLHASRVNPLRVVNDTRPWSDGNADGVPQVNELGVSTGFALGATTRYRDDLDRPYTNEVNVAIEQQLPGNMAAAVGYFFRQTKRNLGSRNLAVPTSTYTPLSVVERTSGQPVTVYDQALSTRGLFDVVIDNAPELDAQFHGVDLTITKRLSDGWMVLGGMALGKNVGNTYTANSDLNNPNFTFLRGRVSADIPLSLKLAVLYDLPYGLSLGANAQHYSGFPESDTVVVSRDTAVLTQVSQSVRIAPQGTNRLPGVTLVDLSVRRRFRLFNRLSAEPVLEVFNLANANTVTSRSTLLGPVYHRVNGILPGRLVRFGFDVKF